MYLSKYEVDTADDTILEQQLGKSGTVITKLKIDLSGVGYKLYINNWYTSEKLFWYLEENKTGACDITKPSQLKVLQFLMEDLLEKSLMEDLFLPQDYEILGWCPAGPVLPHGEKVPL